MSRPDCLRHHSGVPRRWAFVAVAVLALAGCTGREHVAADRASPSNTAATPTSAADRWGVFSGKCRGLRITLAVDDRPVLLNSIDMQLNLRVGQRLTMSAEGPCREGAGLGVHGEALRRVGRAAAVVARVGAGFVQIEFPDCYEQACAGGIATLGTARIIASAS